MLGGGISQFVGYFGGRFFRIAQVLTGQEQALLGKVAENSGLEGFFKSSLQFIFIQSHGPGYFGQVGRTMDPLIDQVPDGDDLLFIRLAFYKDLFFSGGGMDSSEVAGLGAQDQQLYAFGEKK